MTDSPLQFETAIEPAETAAGQPDVRHVTCAACQRPIPDVYYDVNGTSVCGSCHAEIARHAETPRGFGTLARSIVFGLGAAIAGAALYYAVIAITNFEIGLVAIAIGYMVGFAIRKGAGGRGGRRFQILAIVLTYWAVGLAYVPMVLRDVAAARHQQPQGQQPGAAVAETAGVADDGGRDRGLAVLAAMLFAFAFALPVLAIVGSMPSGLISAAIIAFGMHQAWRMTGRPELEMTGPYQISSTPPTPA